LRRDEFAFGDNVENVISETRFASRRYNAVTACPSYRRECERGREMTRRAGERWSGADLNPVKAIAGKCSCAVDSARAGDDMGDPTIAMNMLSSGIASILPVGKKF
jgi:hypothetical protein